MSEVAEQVAEKYTEVEIPRDWVTWAQCRIGGVDIVPRLRDEHRGKLEGCTWYLHPIDPPSVFPDLDEPRNAGRVSILFEDESQAEKFKTQHVSPKGDQAVNILRCKYDPTGFQIEEGGKTYRLCDLSRDDLLQVACDAMQAIELLDQNARKASDIVDDWRAGKTIPNSED